MSRNDKKDGYYWLIPDWFFFNPNSNNPNHINRIYRSALGQVWMNRYNKDYANLYSWYWYDDQDYRPICPYCGKLLKINDQYSGRNGHQFNIYKYYLSTCGSIECINKWNHDWHQIDAHRLTMDNINSNPNRLDWIARSSRSNLINHHEVGNFYIAFRVDGKYKFGVTSTELGVRAGSGFFGPTYRYYHSILSGSMKDISTFEYNIKRINNWSELVPTFQEFKSLFYKIYNSKDAFKYDPKNLIEL